MIVCTRVVDVIDECQDWPLARWAFRWPRSGVLGWARGSPRGGPRRGRPAWPATTRAHTATSPVSGWPGCRVAWSPTTTSPSGLTGGETGRGTCSFKSSATCGVSHRRRQRGRVQADRQTMQHARCTMHDARDEGSAATELGWLVCKGNEGLLARTPAHPTERACSYKRTRSLPVLCLSVAVCAWVRECGFFALNPQIFRKSSSWYQPLLNFTTIDSRLFSHPPPPDYRPLRRKGEAPRGSRLFNDYNYRTREQSEPITNAIGHLK